MQYYSLLLDTWFMMVCLSYLFSLILLLSSFLSPSFSGIISASQLELCDQTSPSLLHCQERFVIALTVQNGQNATDSVTTYNLGSATDAQGNSYAFTESIEISLVKSRIILEYPLTYARNYNNNPREACKVR